MIFYIFFIWMCVCGDVIDGVFDVWEICCRCFSDGCDVCGVCVEYLFSVYCFREVE